MSSTMKNIWAAVAMLLMGVSGMAQGGDARELAYKDGEMFKFRIHYGMFNASYATLRIQEKDFNDQRVMHVQGEGRSTGMLGWFFKVEDYYETYLDKDSIYPHRFVRNINEGGHIKDIIIDFDHKKLKANIHNRKYDSRHVEDIKPGTQDMVSAFYYLRNVVDVETLQLNDEFVVPMFFDGEAYDFKLKFLGYDTVRTKFGKTKALKFRPYVQSGRVFKEEESLTVWISNDSNKIPIKIKAKLLVGSITASLDDYDNLKYPMKFD